MENKNQGRVDVHYSGTIGKVEFYHPQSNSLPGELLDDIAQAINRLSADEKVSVIVLSSIGDRTFCAGASFDELMAIEDEKTGLEFFSGFAKVINAIRKSSKFVIVKVQGKAVGGGVGIIAAADYALAHESASVKLSELALGIGPFVVGPAVERKLGLTAFSELAIDAGNWRTANWASANALYNEIYQSQENLNEGVERLAKTLSKYSPDAMAELKKVFWKGTENWDTLLAERAAISGRLVLSDFTKKFISDFKNKA